MAAVPAPTESRGFELEFVAHRAAVLAMLRAEFRDVDDHDDIYQDAWAEALEHIARGEEIANLRAFLKRVAWRKARAVGRNTSAIPADPIGYLLTSRPDARPTAHEQLEVKVDANLIRHVLEHLDPREAAVIKLRFDLGMDSKQIEQALGLSPKRLEKLMTRAYKAIERQLKVDSSGEMPWTRRQRSLLVACLSGLATDAQMARARQLVAEDPSCRAMLAQMRATFDRVAVALPMPVVLDAQREQGVAVLDRLNETGASLRDSLTSSAGRAGGHTTTLEPVTGGLASLGTAGAAKVALVCLSLGGGTAVCIEAGVFGLDHPTAASVTPKAKPAKEERPAKVKPRPKTLVEPKAPVRVSAPKSTASSPRPRTNGPAAASPAPPGSTEFGPGSIGSVPASTEPAAAPLDGGGEFTP